MLTELQEIIARLYPSEEDARRLVAEAGIPPAFVNFDKKAVIVAGSIVTQAHERDLLESLIEVIRNDYPEILVLVQMLGALRWQPATDPEVDMQSYRAEYRRKTQEEINEEMYTLIRANQMANQKMLGEIGSLRQAVSFGGGLLIILFLIVIGLLFAQGFV